MNGEKGQALPLAILALTIGMLLIAPFLGHASASIIGSRTYADAIAYRNACDAGVEHAIWRLVYGGLQTSIPNPGDHITYSLPETINGVTPTVTVTANTTGGGGATGNITNKIDSFDFDTANGYESNIIQISGSVYAIAYRGTSNKGNLKTITIAADGKITQTAISSLIFDNTVGYTPKIIHISGNVYAIVYRGTSNIGYLKTVSIAADGTINQTIISSLTFDPATAHTPDIIPIAGDVYAIAYRGGSNRGYLITVSIATNGIISQTIISTLQFDTSGITPHIIPIAGNVYAIVYESSGNRDTVKTVTIATNGIISPTIISSLIFDAANGSTPFIVHISGNVYAVIYTGASSVGYLKTITIATNGVISPSVIATLNFGIALDTPYIIPVGSDIYIAVGTGVSNTGVARTLNITAGGTIVNGNISSFTFDSDTGYEPVIINIASGIFAIAYRGPNYDGFVTTLGIATGTAVSTYWIVASAGDTSIQAYVSISSTTASISSWQIK